MNPLSTARTAILELFETARANSATYPTDAEFPIEIRNRRFKKPASGPWGRLTLTFGSRIPISVGGSGGKANLRRTPFILTLQIFVPEHDGEKVAFNIADEILGGMDFESDLRSSGGTKVHTICETATLNAVGKAAGDDDEGAAGMEQFNAVLPGHFDDFPSSLIANDPIVAQFSPKIYLKREVGYSSVPAVSTWENQGTGSDANLVGFVPAVDVGDGLFFPGGSEFAVLVVPSLPISVYMVAQVLQAPSSDIQIFSVGSDLHVGMNSSGALFMQEALLGDKITGPVVSRSEFVIGCEFNAAGSRLFVDSEDPVEGVIPVAAFGSIKIGSLSTAASERPILIRDVVMIEGSHDESKVLSILRNR